MIFADSHCHIDGEQFDADRDEIVKRANDAGVKWMLTVGTGNPHDGEIERAVKCAEKYENVFASVGVHPHDAKLYDDAAEVRLITNVKESSKVIAWAKSDLIIFMIIRRVKFSARFLEDKSKLRKKLDLPVIIHSREADDETVEILTEEYKNSLGRGGVMHCFGGSAATAQAMLEIGFTFLLREM